MAYTTLNLLDNIDRRAFSPTNQNTFTQAERLSLVTEEMESNVFPAIFNLFSEFYVTRTTITPVNDQEFYQIPARAVNGQLRELKLVNSNNNYRDLPLIDIENLAYTAAKGVPEAFYFKNNRIGLYPTPNNITETIAVDYFTHPGASVLPSEAAIITSINTSTNVVSFSSIPSTFTTGTTFDFIRGTGEHEYIGTSYTSTLVSGTDVTFSSLPQDVAVGDYLALEGESPLVQCPTTFRNVLAQYVAARILMDSGQSGGENAYSKAEKMKAEAISLLSPRAVGAMKTISRNWE